tara:strand:- start:860 stop:1750 length:891 start_codon:yes stop_codon:yes gene_type:complete
MRGIDYIDDGAMNGGQSGSDWLNTVANIVITGHFSYSGYNRLYVANHSGYGQMSTVFSKYLLAHYGATSTIAGQNRCDSSYSYHCSAEGYYNSNCVGGIHKLDHSGNQQWSKVLVDNSSQSSHEFNYDFVALQGLDIDDSGNVYVVGLSRATSTRTVGVIAKINANGTMGWQNIFYKTSSNTNACTEFKFVRKNSMDSLVIVGFTREDTHAGYNANGTDSQYDKGIVLKVASDGSGTGTYGDYTYSTSTFALITHNQSGNWTSFTHQQQSNYQNPARGWVESYEQSASDTISTTSM